MSVAARRTYWGLVLQQIGSYSLTEWRLQFFEKWASYENTGALFNPLATTRTVADDEYKEGDPNWNSNDGVPVKNYRSLTIGARATAETLNLGYYMAVRSVIGLQSIPSNLAKTVGDILANIWGTVGFGKAIESGWQPQGSKFAIEPEQPAWPTDFETEMRWRVSQLEMAVTEANGKAAYDLIATWHSNHGKSLIEWISELDSRIVSSTDGLYLLTKVQQKP